LEELEEKTKTSGEKKQVKAKSWGGGSEQVKIQGQEVSEKKEGERRDLIESEKVRGSPFRKAKGLAENWEARGMGRCSLEKIKENWNPKEKEKEKGLRSEVRKNRNRTKNGKTRKIKG